MGEIGENRKIEKRHCADQLGGGLNPLFFLSSNGDKTQEPHKRLFKALYFVGRGIYRGKIEKLLKVALNRFYGHCKDSG